MEKHSKNMDKRNISWFENMELLKSYEFYYCQFLTGFQEALVFRLHQDSRGQPPCFAQISVGHVKSPIVNNDNWHGVELQGQTWLQHQRG